MTNKRSHHILRPSHWSIMEEAKTMALYTKNLERAKCRKLDEHEHKLTTNEILGSDVTQEEHSGDRVRDYMTGSEPEKLKEDNVQPPLEAGTRHIATRMVEESTGHVFAVCYDL